MKRRLMNRLLPAIAAVTLAWPAVVVAQSTVALSTEPKLTVLMSGGFYVAYEQLLPEFEKVSGIQVKTVSGASQGKGPGTIEAQLARGVTADVVILAREGLAELAAAQRVIAGSAKELAHVGLGIAVRSGADKPDVATLDAYKATLLKARTIAMPGSTSGIWMMAHLFPRLGIVDKIQTRILPRGTDCTDLVAAGGADLTILPISEILHAKGVDFAGPVAPEAQFDLVFTAAIVAGSPNTTDAAKLIAFLSSPRAAQAVRKSGMQRPASTPAD